MSRPVYPRTYYYLPDISVKLEDESHKRFMEQLHNKYGDEKHYLNYSLITADTGLSADVIRHFKDGKHIRLSSLEKLKEALDYKTLIKPITQE